MPKLISLSGLLQVELQVVALIITMLLTTVISLISNGTGHNLLIRWGHIHPTQLQIVACHAWRSVAWYTLSILYTRLQLLLGVPLTKTSPMFFVKIATAPLALGNESFLLSARPRNNRDLPPAVVPAGSWQKVILKEVNK